MCNKDFTIIPTNTCDMNCEFCHENKKEYRIDLTNKQLELFINKIVNQLDDIKNGIPISLFGGEPLLNKENIIFLSKHKYARYMDIRIFTNLNKFEFDDLYIFSSFKKVSINTNLDVFQNKLFYKTKKYQIIKYLKENTNVDVKPHCIISKEKMGNLLYYAPKLKTQLQYMKNIGLLFDIIFPQQDDYTIDDYVNLITFYNYINDETIFNLNISKIIYFIELIGSNTFQMDKCNLSSNDELTIKSDGSIIPCRRFYNYNFSKSEIDKIEENAKKCNTCKFNSFCEVCKYSHYGIDNTPLKCNRVYNILKALELIELKGIKKIDEDLFTLSIVVGNKCDKNCYFCYMDKTNNEKIDLKNLESFLINNYWKINDLDTLLGGEPLLYLNEEYEFLKKYFDQLHIISNTYSKNEYVKNNSDFIKITMSIQDEHLEKLNYMYYRDNLESSLILLNNEVLKNIFNTIKLLEENKIEYRFIELYSYKHGDNLVDKNNIKDIIKLSSIFKNFKKASYKRIKDEKCIYKKINIDKNKVTVCGTLYYGAEVCGEKDKYILSYNLNKYIINKKDIESCVKSLNNIEGGVCIANKYSVYENLNICNLINKEN